jgi:molybdopterin converting factor subunit 1
MGAEQGGKVRARLEIQVLFFGGLREGVGRRSDVLGLDSDMSVGELVDQLSHAHASLAKMRTRVRIAVNEEFVPSTHRLTDGDVVAIIPPIAGGADPYCRLSDQPLSVDEVLMAVTAPGQGGVVVFLGFVRDHNAGKQVVRLEYEAYDSMVHTRLSDIIGRCESAATGVRVAVAHRTGSLDVGEIAVVVAASAPHRAEAFDAARSCIELLKQEVPIWKKEFSPDGAQWLGLEA